MLRTGINGFGRKNPEGKRPINVAGMIMICGPILKRQGSASRVRSRVRVMWVFVVDKVVLRIPLPILIPLPTLCSVDTHTIVQQQRDKDTGCEGVDWTQVALRSGIL
jgi:hypothetical protein